MSGGVTGKAREGLPMSMCAEHVRESGGESPLPNLMEVKGKRSARALPVREGLKEAWSEPVTRRTGIGWQAAAVGRVSI